VVQALCRLIRFRTSHPAFTGELSLSGDGSQLVLMWRHGSESARLDADLAARTATLTWTDDGALHSVASLWECPDLR
jgi:sucrose phosphorylase